MTGPLISPLTSAAQVLDRQSRMLRSALGPVIAGALADPDIVEILLNPDGSLWFDRLGAGRTPSGITMPAGPRIQGRGPPIIPPVWASTS